MKGGTAIEKTAILPVVAVAPAPSRRGSRLRRIACYGAAVYATYCLTTAALVHQGRRLEAGPTGPESDWALNAFNIGHHNVDLAQEELDVEGIYLATPDAKSAVAASRAYATHPHLAGSVEDYADAKVILELFQTELGIVPPSEFPLYSAGTEESRKATLGVNKLKTPTAWIDKYYPVMNTPLSNGLEILGYDGSAEWTADLVEDGDPGDPEAAEYRDFVPTFHGLSRDGEAEGQVIYANYGTKEDYDELVASGTNLTDKIVLVRYGGNFRGLKIKGAEELGAVGVLIYSDPRDDGSVTAENGYATYPYGPARNPTSVQRGSVQYISAYPGDPTTPGLPAYENATRTEAANIPNVPSLPISWANAQRLLKEIDASADARLLNGKISEKTVKLVNHVNTRVIPIWNTMAAIPGHISSETVVVGCHRDAWVMGAADPVSGTVSLHEVIRGFGALLKSGWKPLRNVVFASWDAEEYGLIGSTEWAEDFPEWITDNVVAYLNVDVSVSGSRWSASASPSLAHLIQQAALDVPHPTVAGKSLWDALDDKGPYTGPADADFTATYEAAAHHRQASDTKIEPLGSGSDYTPFLQRLGIASSDGGFGQTSTDAPYHYHSIYDSERWEELYGDPGFHRHVAVAQHLGLITLRMTDAIILPLNTTQYALELDDYLDQVESVAASLALPTDFAGLRTSIAALQAASAALDVEKTAAEAKFRALLAKLQHAHAPGHACAANKLPGWLKKILRTVHRWGRRGALVGRFVRAAKRVQRANAKLVAFERGFVSEEGIQGRTWYKHLVVAPGKWLGYGATTLPSITEALTFDHDAALAQDEAARVSELLDKLASELTA